ncbi:GPI-anchored surface protein, putative [Bodo saltans]|uniref:GPI-anchored surface protein, putative n=1 Tax=Bodo saltans TaxID=75058 RepID=A0A0S4INS0_BODSA|nr:GPI-anchored surface protein, putative [Bodo saltans]|eukprot:CUE89290.1 GPI-anchored surface protein, putative [Bodo saltans]
MHTTVAESLLLGALLSYLCVIGSHAAGTHLYSTIPATLEDYTGTCKVATTGFDIGAYYNLDAIQQTSGSSFPPLAADLTNSSWDLGKDGAFSGFTVMYCEIQDFPGYTPTNMLSLLATKGVVVEESCNFQLLSTRNATTGVLKYSVLIIADLGLINALTNADVSAIVSYYTSGGSLFMLSNSCPSVKNANQILAALPSPVNQVVLGNANSIYPSKLMTPGDPRKVNEFGFHVAFTGVPSMSSGQSSAVPYSYANSLWSVSGGIYAPLLTQPLSTSSLSSCSGDPSVATSPTSFPAALYLDPLVQLASLPAARGYGRLAIDMAISRYRGQDDTRTGSRRFGANLIIWLLDIEGKWSNTTSSQSSASTSSASSKQLVACSSGDSFRIKTIGPACNVDFYPIDAGTPNCISKVVTVNQGTTCQVGIRALYGDYWIITNGQNTTMRIVLTANLFTRLTVTHWTGSCRLVGVNTLYNCSTGSSIHLTWNLPSPTRGGYLSQAGPGVAAVNCTPLIVGSFQLAGGQNVTCVLGNTTRVPRGYAQLFIDDVSTGVSVFIDNPLVPNINLLLCSISTTRSKSHSSELTVTETLTTSTTLSGPTRSISKSVGSMTWDATSSMTITSDETITGTGTGRTASESGGLTTATTTDSKTMMTVTKSASDARRSASTTVTTTFSLTSTFTVSTTRRSHTNPSHTLSLTESPTFGCVTPQQLATALLPYAQKPPMATLHELDVQRGLNVTLVLYPIPHIEDNLLHIPWFQPAQCPVRVFKRLITNQGGFQQYLWTAANITVYFEEGLGASSTLPAGTTRNGVVRLEVPAIPDYHILETEVVDLEIPASCATLTFICNATYNNVTLRFNESIEGVRLMRFAVVPSDPPARSSALSVLQPVVIVVGLLGGAPSAVSNLQLMMLHAMSDCGTAFQRVFFVRDVLSIMVPGYEVGRRMRNNDDDNTLDIDVWASLIYGALFWLVALLCLQYFVVVSIACFGRQTLSNARAMASCPSLWLLCGFAFVFPAAVFASLQRIAEFATSANTTTTTASALQLLTVGAVSDNGGAATAFAWAIVLLCVCVVVVPGILIYRLYFVRAVDVRAKTVHHSSDSEAGEDDDDEFSETAAADMHSGVPLSSIIPSLGPKSTADESSDAHGTSATKSPPAASNFVTPSPRELMYGDHDLCLMFSVYEYHEAALRRGPGTSEVTRHDDQRTARGAVSPNKGDGLFGFDGVDDEDTANSYELLLFGQRRRSEPNQRSPPLSSDTTDASHVVRTTQSTSSSWRVGDNAPWGIRWLSQSMLLPKGRWGPAQRSATYGLFLSNRYARPERYWWLLERLAFPLLISSVIVCAHGNITSDDPADAWPENNAAIILGVRVASPAACHGVLSVVCVLYIIKLIVFQYCQPFNVRGDLFLSHASDGVQLLFFIVVSCQLATSSSAAIEGILAILVALQFTVVILSAIFTVTQWWWILPSIQRHVRQKLLFAWCNPPPAPSDLDRTDNEHAQKGLRRKDSGRSLEEVLLEEGDANDGSEGEGAVDAKRSKRRHRFVDRWRPSELETGDILIRNPKDEAILHEMRSLGILPLLLENDTAGM